MTIDDTPEAFLLRFFRCMSDWEAASARVSEQVRLGKLDQAIAFEERIGELDAIFLQFTNGHDARRRGPAYQTPPEYSHTEEKITNVDLRPEGGAVIQTERLRDPKDNCRYYLIKKNGRWLIDAKQIVSAYTGKVRDAIL